MKKTGIVAMIVDANAISQDVLGKASVLKEEIETLEGIIRDNPSGQETQMTPFILVREITKVCALRTDAVEEGVTE